MKTLIAYRKPTWLTTLYSVLMSFTFMIIWLPFLRAIFDGASYGWGTTYYGFSFRGAGVNQDFIFIILQLAFYALLMFSLFWMKNRNWFYGLLIVWFFNVFGNLLFDIVWYGDTMFHGDTLNVHVSLTAVVVPLSLLALAMIFFLVKWDRKAAEESIVWNSRNRQLMWMILGPLPIQAVLFAIGEPHGLTDQVGVVISIVQSFAIPVFLRPFQMRSK